MILLGIIGFKEIALIILGYLLVRFVLGVRRARKTVMDMKSQMEEQMREAQRAANQRPEGEISIDRGVPPRNKKDSDDGEFVDFEEVE